MTKEAPKQGSNAKYAGSELEINTQKRTTENINPRIKARRDKFIEGIIMGLPQYRAAMHAGAPRASAAKQGSMLMMEPYVSDRIKKIREAMDEEDLLTKKELLLNVKSIAFNEEEQSRTRVSAHSLLTDIMGWKRSKVEVTGANGGPLEFSEVQIDPTKLSDKALEELLNAAAEAKHSDSTGD